MKNIMTFFNFDLKHFLKTIIKNKIYKKDKSI